MWAECVPNKQPYAKRPLPKIARLLHKHFHTTTDIATYRLNWPWGHFSNIAHIGIFPRLSQGTYFFLLEHFFISKNTNSIGVKYSSCLLFLLIQYFS